MRKPDESFTAEALAAPGVPARKKHINGFSIGGDAIADTQADKGQLGAPAADSEEPIGVVRSKCDLEGRDFLAECVEVMQTIADKVNRLLTLVQDERGKGINAETADKMVSGLKGMEAPLSRYVSVNKEQPC